MRTYMKLGMSIITFNGKMNDELEGFWKEAVES
jgi:hypothetical protein